MSQLNLFETEELKESTSYRGGSHASRTALQESVYHLVMSVTCGPNTNVSLARLNQDGLWLKMYGDCFQVRMDGSFEEYSETLPGWGFNVGWLTYPASWVGAIHRRARVFIVANSNRERRGSMGENKQNQRGTVFTQEPYYPEGGAWLDAEAAELLHSGERALYFEGGVNLRNDNGLSEGIHRLTCLGNAVMPQQAYPIFKAIMEIERRNEK